MYKQSTFQAECTALHCTALHCTSSHTTCLNEVLLTHLFYYFFPIHSFIFLHAMLFLLNYCFYSLLSFPLPSGGLLLHVLYLFFILHSSNSFTHVPLRSLFLIFAIGRSIYLSYTGTTTTTTTVLY